MPRVLVVDDEKLIVKGIRFSLEQDGMEVDCAYDGEEAVELAKKTEYDIVLLDVMLPKLDGYEVCQAIREFSDMPIIMLTAKGGDMDKILGLEYGADDYISKPFNILEVKARIKAIIRRSSKNRRLKKEEANNSVIGQGDLKMDTESRRVFIGEREINLTAKEFDLLELLVQQGHGQRRCPHRGRPCEKAEGKDRAKPKRPKVCTYEVGRWILFPCKGLRNGWENGRIG